MNLSYLCHRCVREPFLSWEIKVKGLNSPCSYCDQTGPAFPLKVVAERIKTAFSEHFNRTSDQPSDFEAMAAADRELNYVWDRHGQPVLEAIMDAADVDEAVAEDLQTILQEKFADFDMDKAGEECEFADGSHYEEKGVDDSMWHNEWFRFEKLLKTEARFFSKEAARILQSIFQGIDDMQTSDGQKVIVEAGPKAKLTSFYRARVFQSKEKLCEALCRPDVKLGSPESFLAAAGRMNAHGISVFYGATEADTAIAEVRPPVGSQVALARFLVTRPLRLLDLSALSAVMVDGSIFDPKYLRELERASFLRSLSHQITKAVMPDDQAFEYLPTQAVADFLASDHITTLDGILFSSIQASDPGQNVVLFHKAARVKKLELAEGTTLEATTGFQTDEGWDEHFAVWEELPPAKILPPESPDFDALFPRLRTQDLLPYSDDDERATSLEIDLNDITVHRIHAASFRKSSFKVSRHTKVKTEPPY